MRILVDFRAISLLLILAVGLSLPAAGQEAPPKEPTYQFTVEFDEKALGESAKDEPDINAAIKATIDVLSARLNGAEHSISLTGEHRINVIISGVDSRAMLKAALGNRGVLDFKLLDPDAAPSASRDGIAPPGSEILPMADGSRSVAVRKSGGIGGEHLTNAVAGIDPDTNEHVINLQFDDAGAAKLATLTQENVGNPMAIVLDGEVLSAPIIYEPIVGGALQISGNFTAQTANELAIAMKSGALPVPLKIVAERQLN